MPKLNHTTEIVRDMLIAAGPDGATVEEILHRLYGADPDGGPDWAENRLRLTISNLRRSLKIQTVRTGDMRNRVTRYRLETMPGAYS